MKNNEPKQRQFSDRIKISVVLEDGDESSDPPEIEVAQTCFHITRSLFQILAIANGYGGGFMHDDRVEPSEAIYEVSILGVIFTDIAFNALDAYGMRSRRENNGGKKIND